ncbi:MAG TPA: RNase H family protein [Pirellulaceae bacterium]|jgi:ribonuclease HI|nr:RNase H family protein [Pirellulaceae bacterium]
MERPHYLLFAEANVEENVRHGAGRWRFALESLDGASRIEADDVDDDARLDRLNLLAVVRGLEALEGPSRVTLLTMSWYVRRGFSEGLELWRQNNWRWETFGQMTSVTNEDLWRRVDRALQFHIVQCRTWRLDASEAPAPHLAVPVSSSTRIAAPASPAPAMHDADPYRATVREPQFLKRKKTRIESHVATAPSSSAAKSFPSDAPSMRGEAPAKPTYWERMQSLVAAPPEEGAPVDPPRRKRA